MAERLIDKAAVDTLTDSDFVYGAFGGATRKMTIGNFRKNLNQNDQQVLNDLAFYIDINSASSKGSARVDVGGNLGMIDTLWGMRQNVLMDANGNYCHLSRNDSRYTEDGELIIDTSTNQLRSKWSNCDMMVILPESYGKIQAVTVGSTTKYLPWFSAVPLPGGFTIPQQVVGMFKATNVSSAMRSLPGYVSDSSATINTFWSRAQTLSKNHGLANLDFQNYLLFYMMSKYGYRDSQGCKSADGSLVWGVGLDGTENTSGSSDSGFTRQSSIKHGACMSLGLNDGNAAVTDSAGGTAHSVNVAGFENPWGQRWEMRQGLCSVGTDVYCWRANWLPTGTPTASSFSKVDYVKLTRATSSGQTLMNIVSSTEGQGVYMIPKASASGIAYNDYYYYSESGQLWLFGGHSVDDSKCGLAYSRSLDGWSDSFPAFSARLAYYGTVKRVTPTELAKIA
ncbi:MAG: hypothetical protein ACI4T5_09730 [Prevotella sp.]